MLSKRWTVSLLVKRARRSGFEEICPPGGGPEAALGRVRTHLSPSLFALKREVTPADQIVATQSQDEHPLDQVLAAMTELAHQRRRLEPTENRFYELALAKADLITRVSRCATVQMATSVFTFTFCICGVMLISRN
jgi:hypothetical protein